MKQRNSDIKQPRIYTVVDISADEKNKAKVLAKSRGMSLQGFIGQLVKNELKNSEVQNG